MPWGRALCHDGRLPCRRCTRVAGQPVDGERHDAVAAAHQRRDAGVCGRHDPVRGRHVPARRRVVHVGGHAEQFRRDGLCHVEELRACERQEAPLRGCLVRQVGRCDDPSRQRQRPVLLRNDGRFDLPQPDVRELRGERRAFRLRGRQQPVADRLRRRDRVRQQQQRKRQHDEPQLGEHRLELRVPREHFAQRRRYCQCLCDRLPLHEQRRRRLQRRRGREGRHAPLPLCRQPRIRPGWRALVAGERD